VVLKTSFSPVIFLTIFHFLYLPHQLFNYTSLLILSVVPLDTI